MYQLTLVIKSSVKDTDRKRLLDSIKESFGKAQIKEEEWGQKPLAYPIRKEVSGIFFNWFIDSEATVSSGFETKLRNEDNVLRYLLLRTKTKPEQKEVKKKTAKTKKE